MRLREPPVHPAASIPSPDAPIHWLRHHLPLAPRLAQAVEPSRMAPMYLHLAVSQVPPSGSFELGPHRHPQHPMELPCATPAHSSGFLEVHLAARHLVAGAPKKAVTTRWKASGFLEVHLPASQLLAPAPKEAVTTPWHSSGFLEVHLSASQLLAPAPKEAVTPAQPRRTVVLDHRPKKR